MLSVLLGILHDVALGLILPLEVRDERLGALGALLAQVSQLQNLPAQDPLIPLLVFVDLALFVHFSGCFLPLVEFVDVADVEE